MMKLHVVFATVPMMGHVVPLIPYAEELLSRGHDVTFVHHADEKYRQKLEQSGLARCKSITYGGSGDSNSIYECIKGYFSVLTDKPSIIVHDFFAVDAADAADSLGVPSIGVFPNIAVTINPWAASPKAQTTLFWAFWCMAVVPSLETFLSQIIWLRRSVTRLNRKLPVLYHQDVYPSRRQPKKPMIGCTSPLLEFNAATSLGNDAFHMVGPAAPTMIEPVNAAMANWIDDQKLQGKKIVYVAFGSMFKHTQKSVRSLYSDLLTTNYGGNNIAIIWSLRKEDQQHLSDQSIPENWRVEVHVPQDALFRTGKVDAFVTHCGSNSVSEALLSGIPMVCCPGFADQPGNALRLVRLGVGVMARRKGTDYGVKSALGAMLVNLKSVRNKATELAAALHKEGNGAKKAATIIEDAVKMHLPEGAVRK